MYYKAYWMEYHDPENWDGVANMKKEILAALRFVMPKGIARIKAQPDPAENDGWYQCEVEVEFQAKNAEEAKNIISDKGLKDDSSGVFTCFVKQGRRWVKLFTEEDMEDM